MNQRTLLGLDTALETKVISRKQDFEDLFDGFGEMHAVSYVASPDLLLDFFDRRSYSRIEIVVGGEEQLAQSYRSALQQKGVELTQKLADMVERGSLSILIPSRVIHSKLYILRNADRVRVIQGSANLTRTAQQASRQQNLVWYVDLTPTDPQLKRFEEDYEIHRRGCGLFLADLLEKLQQQPSEDHHEVIEAWLYNTPVEGRATQVTQVWQNLAEKAVENPTTAAEIVTIQVSPSTRRQIERVLQPLHPVPVDEGINVRPADFVQYVDRTYRLPIMRVDLERRQIRVRLGESLLNFGEPPPQPGVLDAVLAHIEEYIRAFERGQTSDSKTVIETYVYEALLYVLSSPFAYLHMEARQRAFRLLTGIRGPRILYIYGGTRTGKSSFLQFALKTLTNRDIKPLVGMQQFVPTTVRQMANTGTVFPLVFDDIARFHQNVVKGYWESWWQGSTAWPQIVLTSNSGTLPEAAKSRVMRVLFDVYFPPNNADLRYLNDLLAKDNPLFTWFAYRYLERLNTEDATSEDELAVARKVMIDLYQHAGRDRPVFFPDRPVEDLYPSGARNWRNLLYRDKKAIMRTERGRIRVDFKPDIQMSEVKAYAADLPPAVRCDSRGKTLFIEPPEKFNAWFASGGASRTLVQRLLRR